MFVKFVSTCCNKIFCSCGSELLVFIAPIPGLFLGPGIRQNTVRDKGSVNGIRDYTATRKAGFTKIWARMRDWEYSGCKRLSMHCLLFHSRLYGDPCERVLLNHTRRNTGFTSFAAHNFGLELTPKHPAAWEKKTTDTQGWLWLIVKETNIQTAMTEVPRGNLELKR